MSPQQVGERIAVPGKPFTQEQLQALADALGDTSEGLTGSEIAHLLRSAKMVDVDPNLTKRHRLYNAFVHHQNSTQDRTNILAFVRKAMKPASYVREPERFEPMRLNVNRALAFAGMQIDASGVLSRVGAASTLSEAERRARDLRQDLHSRGVHQDVLRFCRAELIADNYFHAVLEAVKSVADKLRNMSGLTSDGAALVDATLSGSSPMMAINELTTKSEQDEQKGFANLLKGTFGMFRNPTAHEARVNWKMKKEDAEDLMSLLSLMHRRLDSARVLRR